MGDRSNTIGDTEDAFEKKVKEFTNDSDGEVAVKEGDTPSVEDMNSSNIKLEDVSSQDFSSSQDDSFTSHNDQQIEAQEDKVKGEVENDPKYAWKDRSRTSEEFELSLEINDKDFLETVRSEYRSSSPSWANKKFKFPVKKERTEKKVEETLPEIEDDKGQERSVSVRKRMQDEIKKEQEERVDVKEEKFFVDKLKKVEECSTQDSIEALKIKGERLRRKDRQYRSSKDELNSSTEKDDGCGKDDRRREDRSSSRTFEREEDRSERKKREERQKERDKKDRERNERIKEEEEERRRRRKLEDERRKDEIRKYEEEKRREKKRIEERDREDRERRKIEEDERKRRRAEEESRRKREKLEEENRRLDEERREIERKRGEDRKREKEKLLVERRERDSRKRSRSPVEESQKVKKGEKKLAIGDLRKRLEDKKKKVSKKQDKKIKKKKKKDSSSSSSSDSSSSSSSGESESEDSDNPAQAILKDKNLLK